MKQLIVIFLLIVVNSVRAQTPQDFGFIEHSISDKKLGKVNFYVSDTLHDQKKPLLIFLDGSGDQPIFSYKRDPASGKLMKYSSLPIDLKMYKNKYHIMVISKPNIPFFRKKSDQENLRNDSIYDLYASCDWRVESADKAINLVIKKYNTDKTQIIVFGYSEGAQVAPRLAVKNKKITHCIAFVGGGLNQFYDQIINYRILAEKGEITHEEAQQNIDSLYITYQCIYADPNSTTANWYGHTYKRWSSYTLKPTIEYFQKLKIPVYIAQGTADRSTHVLSSDYIKLEFLRLGKYNLILKNYPDLDHFFTHTKTGKNYLDEVISEALVWTEKE